MRAYKYNIYVSLNDGVFRKLYRGNSPLRAIAAWNRGIKNYPDQIVAWELFNIRDKPTLDEIIEMPEEKLSDYKRFGWDSKIWSPDGYYQWRPEFHPITGEYLKSTYMSIDDIISMLNEKNIPIEYEICGSPNDDDDFKAQWESLRKRFAREDALNRRMWVSTSGCGKWESLVRAHNTTPADFIRKCYADHNSFDLGNVFENRKPMQNGLGSTYEGWPQKIVIDLSRYGYGIHSVYGEASEEDKRLNRLGSAVVGFPADDFDPKNEGLHTHSETIQMICAEWVGRKL